MFEFTYFSWRATINGKEYGVSVSDPDCNDLENAKSAIDLFTKNIKETFDLIAKEEEKNA